MTTTDALRPPAHPLDPRVRRWWRLHCVLAPGVALVALVVLALLLAAPRPWLLGAAVVTVIATGAGAACLPAFWYRRHRWEVTDDAVYARSGLLWIEWRAAPLSRVQTVDTTRGPLQQLAGIATLVVTTASARGPVTVRGLDGEQAASLAERLTRRAQAVPGDAT